MYSSHLKRIKKTVNQSCPKTRMCFRTTLMNGFDPLQMLTSVYVLIYLLCTFKRGTVSTVYVYLIDY